MRTCGAIVLIILTSPMLVSCSSQRPLSVVQATAPNFPRIAQIAYIQGDMVVAVGVAPDGKVSSATIVSGPALNVLRQASLDAAGQWIFERSSRSARRQMLTFEFRIEGQGDEDYREVRFLPPAHLLVSVHPVETEDPNVAITHPKHR